LKKIEKTYLEDTLGILSDYDGNRTAEGLMKLIDETRDRLKNLLKGEVTKKDI
jgi:hypothetical protein